MPCLRCLDLSGTVLEKEMWAISRCSVQRPAEKPPHRAGSIEKSDVSRCQSDLHRALANVACPLLLDHEKPRPLGLGVDQLSCADDALRMCPDVKQAKVPHMCKRDGSRLICSPRLKCLIPDQAFLRRIKSGSSSRSSAVTNPTARQCRGPGLAPRSPRCSSR